MEIYTHKQIYTVYGFFVHMNAISERETERMQERETTECAKPLLRQILNLQNNCDICLISIGIHE